MFWYQLYEQLVNHWYQVLVIMDKRVTFSLQVVVKTGRPLAFSLFIPAKDASSCNFLALFFMY